MTVAITTDIDSGHQNVGCRDAGIDRSGFSRLRAHFRIKRLEINGFRFLPATGVAQCAFDRRVSIVSKTIVAHPGVRQIGWYHVPWVVDVVRFFGEMTLRTGGV